ncbi:MAG: ammonia-forming cytochrome c nitrite reductase subunit c552 [Kofleriaceae bacterium]
MKWLIIGLVAIAAVAGIIIATHGKKDPVAVEPPPKPVTIDMPAWKDTRTPPKKYVGMKACGDCHDDEVAGWQKSWHSRALSPAGDNKLVVGNFANAHYKGASTEATMTTTGKQHVMTTAGPDGQPHPYNVDWVIGGKRMQDSVTVFPDGRWQVLPVYFHLADKQWVDYTETKQGALTPDHPFWWTNARRMANHECLDCHTTNMDVSVKDGTWTTTATDMTVACESCHGPGEGHSDSKANIIQPAKNPIGITACARCHGPRQPLWPLLDHDHAFRLGDDYDENYDPVVVTLPGGGASSDFFADGRPSTSSFEYQAMLQSQCYRKGQMTCTTCHTSPHAGKHAELRDDPDKLCKSCHGDLPADHSHHKKATCVSCHMPPVVSGVLDKFADHAIDIPVPQNTAKHQVPNACTECHKDKTPDQLAQSIQSWYPFSKRAQRRLVLADALAGDPAALVVVITDPTEAPTLRGAAMITYARKTKLLDPILPLLNDKNLVLRAKACEAAGDSHQPLAGEPLATMLKDPSLRVRLACSLALLDIRDPRGELALHQLATDPATQHLMIPHLELGRMAIRKRDWAEAKVQLEQVVVLAPYYVDAIVDLAGIAASVGDMDSAKKHIAHALSLEPKHKGALALQRKLP